MSNEFHVGLSSFHELISHHSDHTLSKKSPQSTLRNSDVIISNKMHGVYDCDVE